MAKRENQPTAPNKEDQFSDEDARVIYVKECTSSDASNSTYVRQETPNPLDADLTLEYRGDLGKD